MKQCGKRSLPDYTIVVRHRQSSNSCGRACPVASLNIFVGLFNLLPLLPLDGGHIAVVIYERCRAWLARLRGKPDPGPVDYRRLVPVSVGVFALLVGFGLLLIMADLVNPVHIIQ